MLISGGGKSKMIIFPYECPFHFPKKTSPFQVGFFRFLANLTWSPNSSIQFLSTPKPPFLSQDRQDLWLLKKISIESVLLAISKRPQSIYMKHMDAGACIQKKAQNVCHSLLLQDMSRILL